MNKFYWPTKEEILECTDAHQLREWLDDIDTARAKKVVDLEFYDGDKKSHEFVRLKKTLAALDITQKSLYGKLKAFTKGDVEINVIKRKELKLGLRQEANQNKEKMIELTKQANEKRELNFKNRIVNVVQQFSLSIEFMHQAKRILTKELFDNIMSATEDNLIKKVTKLADEELEASDK